MSTMKCFKDLQQGDLVRYCDLGDFFSDDADTMILISRVAINEDDLCDVYVLRDYSPAPGFPPEPTEVRLWNFDPEKMVQVWTEEEWLELQIANADDEHQLAYLKMRRRANQAQ